MNTGVIGRRSGEVLRPGADGLRLPVRPADHARRARQCLVSPQRTIGESKPTRVSGRGPGDAQACPLLPVRPRAPLPVTSSTARSRGGIRRSGERIGADGSAPAARQFPCHARTRAVTDVTSQTLRRPGPPTPPPETATACERPGAGAGSGGASRPTRAHNEPPPRARRRRHARQPWSGLGQGVRARARRTGGFGPRGTR